MRLVNFFKNSLISKDPKIIIPFGGFASENVLHTQARVLEDEGIRVTPKDSLFRNILNSYKRFESDEIPNARVRVTFKGFAKEFVSNSEGYITVEEPHYQLINQEESCWLPITYDLLIDGKVVYKTTSEILVVGKNAQFGVITDVDDTIIHTGVSSLFKWQLIVNSFFKKSSSRMALQDVPEFYRKLQVGVSGVSENPFFYLSNSPWNLFTYLTSFLKRNHFPKGVLLLRDMSLDLGRSKSFTTANKFLKIQTILTTYPDKPFILVGDAADIDPDIYIEIAKTFPKRILAIYIHTVANKKRVARALAVIAQNSEIEVCWVHNSKETIRHAQANSFIK